MPDLAKQFAPAARRGIPLRFLDRHGRKVPEPLPVRFGKCVEESFQRRRSFLDQPVAPSFGFVQPRSIARAFARQGGERLFELVGVELAHQAADVLPLPSCGATLVQFTREFYCIPQPGRHGQPRQNRRRQGDQLLAQCLQVVRAPFELGFRRFRAVVVVRQLACWL